KVALRILLEIDSCDGGRIVRVEPGHQLDESAAFTDPRDPNGHPLTVHLEREVLPALATGAEADGSGWLQGIEDVDPSELGAIVASSFAYRRLFRRAVWLTLPVLPLLALLLPVAVSSSLRSSHAVFHVFRLL